MFAGLVVPPYWFIVVFGERLDTLFTSSDSKISGFTRPHVIGFVADLFVSTLESGFIFFRIRCRIRRMRVDGSRIRKEKVADSKIFLVFLFSSFFIWCMWNCLVLKCCNTFC